MPRRNRQPTRRRAHEARRPRDLDSFTSAYIEAALWSTNDESDPNTGGDPLDANYGIGDITAKTMQLIVEDCADFQKRFGHLIADDDSPEIQRWGRDELAGHDFWLTRAGHGAGFWDGGWPKHGDELTEAAKQYGEFYLQVYRGRIHGQRARSLPKASELRKYPKPERGEPHFVTPQNHHSVADFTGIQQLIEHEYRNGATHVIFGGSMGKDPVLYYPMQNGDYEEGAVWQENGYWHSTAPEYRTVVDRPPSHAERIREYLRRSGSKKVVAARRGHSVRDYIAVDPSGRPISGPSPDYFSTKREADRVGGYVKYHHAPSRPPSARESPMGRRHRSWLPPTPDPRVAPEFPHRARRRPPPRDPSVRRRAR